MIKIKSILSLLRPWQWMKNIFVFLPLFFDGRIFDVKALGATFWAYMSFCFAASAIYGLNDIVDAKADAAHPVKCTRPIPSGQISRLTASLISIFCVVCSVLLPSIITDSVAGTSLHYVIIAYLIMNVLYCIKLKQVVIIDVFIIAIGFVFRLIAGGVVSHIHLTHWIILMTFLLALFLALAKRRDDVVIYESTGKSMRKNVTRYNLPFMNQAIGIIACITMMCYIMYTVSADVVARFGTPYLYITSVFVLAGIIRYLQLTIVDVKSGSPTKVLLHDRFVQLCVIGWGLSFLLLIYI